MDQEPLESDTVQQPTQSRKRNITAKAKYKDSSDDLDDMPQREVLPNRGASENLTKPKRRTTKPIKYRDAASSEESEIVQLDEELEDVEPPQVNVGGSIPAKGSQNFAPHHLMDAQESKDSSSSELEVLFESGKDSQNLPNVDGHISSLSISSDESNEFEDLNCKKFRNLECKVLMSGFKCSKCNYKTSVASLFQTHSC